jgi:hypothetical protein
VTGTKICQVLDAAHILPVSVVEKFGESAIMNPNNGIALRSDIHRLFDADLLRFEVNHDSTKVTAVFSPDVDYSNTVGDRKDVTSFLKNSITYLNKRMQLT